MISEADFPDVFPWMAEQQRCRKQPTKPAQLPYNGIARCEDDGGKIPEFLSRQTSPAHEITENGGVVVGPFVAGLMLSTMPVLAIYAGTAAMLTAHLQLRRRP